MKKVCIDMSSNIHTLLLETSPLLMTVHEKKKFFFVIVEVDLFITC